MAFRLFQLCLELGVLHYSTLFFEYLESEEEQVVLSTLDSSSTLVDYLTFHVTNNRGAALVTLIVCIKWPKQFIDEKFYNILCNFLHKIRNVQ